jgi:hypothetical protein
MVGGCRKVLGTYLGGFNLLENNWRGAARNPNRRHALDQIGARTPTGIPMSWLQIP